MTVFVDSSFYVARTLPRDQWHQESLRAIRPELVYVTSSLVINETISLLQSRGFFSAALDFLREIRSNPAVQIVYADAPLQAEAWDLFGRYGASGLNAVDCASFAIMRRFSIKRAFTFDLHFREAGFEILR